MKIYNLLKTRPSNATELAVSLNVSKRTVFRDINLLIDAGCGVLYDTESQKYTIRNTQSSITMQTPPVVLAYLAAYCRSAQCFRAHLEPIASRLVESHARDDVEAGSSFFDFRFLMPAHGTFRQAQVAALCNAYVTRRSVRVIYTDDSRYRARAPRTLFSPYSMVILPDGHAALGRCSISKSVVAIYPSDICDIETTNIGWSHEKPPRLWPERVIRKWPRVA